MKHSVALQSRNAIWSAFFCVVCRVIGMCIAFNLGRNTSLLIAQAKANLLRWGKNPGGLWVSSVLPPLCFNFWGLFSLDNGEHHLGSLSGTVVVSSFGSRLEERSSYLLHE